VLICLAVFWLAFRGYPLEAVHFNTLHFLSKDPFPDFWGLRVVDPATGRVDWSLLYRNEGLMAAELYFLYRLPLVLETKLVLVNVVNLGAQALNAALFAYVVRKLAGPGRWLPYLLLYLLYPFAASNHYWQAGLPVNLAATLFLASLTFFLNVDFAPGREGRNLFCWLLPSLLCLWLSIITVEYAICLSPLFVYLAIYRANGGQGVWRFRRWVTPYTAMAALFLLTSLLPALLFTGHRLTVASYGSRFSDLAQQARLPEGLVKVGVMAGNAVLVGLSYLFANTAGLLVYPLADTVRAAGYLVGLGATVWAPLAVLAALVGWSWWRSAKVGPGDGGGMDQRFLLVAGALWAFLSYFPFLLSIGYPRNVGLHVDRINILGSMGVVLFVGTAVGLLVDRLRPHASPALAVAGALVAALWLVNLEIQKASYVEADWKERALVEAVLQEQQRLSASGREPVFLLERAGGWRTLRDQIREALSGATGTAKLVGLGRFLWERHFAGRTLTTGFTFDGIYFFWCCPASAPVTFNFYADWLGWPRPSVFKREGTFRLEESPDAYRIGYLAQEVWDAPSNPGEFRIYPKSRYDLVTMEIGESTFRLGGPLAYSFRPAVVSSVREGT
jgi:hypothetical protein